MIPWSPVIPDHLAVVSYWDDVDCYSNNKVQQSSRLVLDESKQNHYLAVRLIAVVSFLFLFQLVCRASLASLRM